MIKWIYKPSGNCPVQAEGYFMGKYFYFRSRWSTASIEFSETEKDWDERNILKRYILFEDKKGMGAGWMPKWMAYLCIYKAMLMYLLNFKSKL
jgi:hypothetical protein